MAVEVTVKQMALLRNTEFTERVQALMSRLAGTVLTESSNTPHHTGRAAYAQRVTMSPLSASQQGMSQVVMGVNVVITTTYDEATKTSECTIKDIDLEAQIMSLWNSLAGLDTPS